MRTPVGGVKKKGPLTKKHDCFEKISWMTRELTGQTQLTITGKGEWAIITNKNQRGSFRARARGVFQNPRATEMGPEWCKRRGKERGEESTSGWGAKNPPNKAIFKKKKGRGPFPTRRPTRGKKNDLSSQGRKATKED